MVEDVQVLPIVQPVQIAQDAGTAVVVERAAFVEEVLLEEAHHRVIPVKKVSLENTNLLILINPPKQNQVSPQRYILTKLMSILIPIIEILQKLKP